MLLTKLQLLNTKMVGTCIKTSLHAWLEWYIYDYSSEDDEIDAMPILVR
jgi:hypothetical protein